MPIVYDKRSDGVAKVIIDRPQALNALDAEAKARLAECWRDAAADPQVRAVVLAGAGDRAFCAGSDIKEMARTGRSVPTDLLMRALPGAAAAFDKPIVAALHGYCIGMGLSLAIHCDVRLAAADTVLGFPEVRHGMISAVSAVRLPLMIGFGRAQEMLLLGETISAAEAERIGLVNRVVDGDVLAAADELARRMAANGERAMRATKRLSSLSIRATVGSLAAEIERERAEVEADAEFARRSAAFASRRDAAAESGGGPAGTGPLGGGR